VEDDFGISHSNAFSYDVVSEIDHKDLIPLPTTGGSLKTVVAANFGILRLSSTIRVEASACLSSVCFTTPLMRKL
jgi:hypothetical protein